MRLGEAFRLATSTDWIRPRYAKYLAGPRNVDAERYHADNLLALPERDRTKSWAASGAGKCLRARQFSFLGMVGKPPDEHGLNIFLNGTWVHLRHQVVGLSAGYLEDAEVPVRHRLYNLVGTMDAVDTTGTPVEYKSINQNGYGEVRSFGVRPDHRHQIHSYMLASDADAFRVVYENKNTNDILEFHVEKNNDEIDRVIKDLDTLNTYTDDKSLYTMLDECKRKEGVYRWCPYASKCPTANFQELLAKSVTHRTSSSVSVLLPSPSQQASPTSPTSSPSSTSTGTSSSAG